ncbi:hypothetical protein BGZ51_005021 [Haplosporangium sp. Z 767]|nr:hypothetical protein BGZ51_005021 [Haplosporangium sp. Z 767]
MSRVRTKHDLFIKDWSVQGLLNVKHAIRTCLTKESEDARTAIDDKKYEVGELMADGLRTEVGGWDHHREIELVESWENIRNVRGRFDDRQDDSDDRMSNQYWNSDGDLFDANSVSASNLNSSYQSATGSTSRVPQECLKGVNQALLLSAMKMMSLTDYICCVCRGGEISRRTNCL